jgi:WD40 repeat protein
MTVYEDQAPRFWDTATGKELGRQCFWQEWQGRAMIARHRRSFPEHYLALSPDGRIFAMTLGDGIRIWDCTTATFRSVYGLGGNNAEGGPSTGAFLPDGRALVLGSDSGSVFIHEAETGKEIRSILRLDHRGEFTPLHGMALSADGTLLAVGKGVSGIEEVAVFDAGTGQLRWKHRNIPYRPRAVAFSPDSRLLATSGENYRQEARIGLWDATTGKPVRAIRLPRPANVDPLVLALAFSPDGKLLASGGRNLFPRQDPDYRVYLWEVATGQRVQAYEGHQQQVFLLSFSPDGRTLASGSQDGTVLLWDVNAGRPAKGERRPRAGPRPQWETWWRALAGEDAAGAYQATCAFGALGAEAVPFLSERLAAAGEKTPSLLAERGLRALEAMEAPEAEEALARLAAHEPAGALALGARAALARIKARREARTPPLRLRGPADTYEVDVPWALRIRCLRGHRQGVTALAFSRDRKLLASASQDNTVRVWELTTGKCLAPLQGHDGPVYGVAFSRAGLLASAGADGLIVLWEGTTGREVRRMRAGESTVAVIAFAPDGKTLASGGYDGLVRLWDCASGRELRTLRGLGMQVTALAFADKGSMLFAGGADGSPAAGLDDEAVAYLRAWDVSSGRALRAPPARATALGLSADGRVLAVGRFTDVRHRPGFPLTSFPSTVCTAVDPTTGAVLGPGVFPGDSLALTPDGGTLATARGPGLHYADGTNAWLRPDEHESLVRLYEVRTGKKVLQCWNDKPVVLACSADARLLAGGSADGNVCLWDLTCPPLDPREAAGPLSAEQLQAHWTDLAGSAGRAYGARWALVRSPRQAVALAAARVPPASQERMKQQERLIQELDDESFEVREAATRELRGRGLEAEHAVRAALAAPGSPERQRRLKAVLHAIREAGPSGALLQQLRAISVLEQVGTDEARAVLSALAGGPEGAPVTGEAQAALGRLRRPPQEQ